MAPPKETFFRWVLAASPPTPSEKEDSRGPDGPRSPRWGIPLNAYYFFSVITQGNTKELLLSSIMRPQIKYGANFTPILQKVYSNLIIVPYTTSITHFIHIHRDTSVGFGLSVMTMHTMCIAFGDMNVWNACP